MNPSLRKERSHKAHQEAGGPPLTMFVCSIATEEPVLAFFARASPELSKGWVAMLPALF